MRLDRRRFTLGAAAIGASTLANPAALAMTRQQRAVLPPAYLVDFDGDGRIGASDERTLSRALGARRGSELRPAPGYDPRADLFARMRVGERDLASLRMLRKNGAPVRQQPVTVAWHYGWHHAKNRPLATSQYLGGSYKSEDPKVEGEFNRLKNEFGVGVDALSWISPRIDERNLRAYKRGYLRASRLGSRHTCMLYESSINLGDGSERVSFIPEQTGAAMVQDFEEMAHFLAQARDDSPARVFEIDSRPVVFIYASHIWGWMELMDAELELIDRTVGLARDRFAAIYGAPPYLVGEEMLLSDRDEFRGDRERRSRNFDGIFVYHHATTPEVTHEDTLGVEYARLPQRLMRLTLERASTLTNRFTGQGLRVFPSLASGFAKKGAPRLWASRRAYTSFLRDMDSYCRSTYFDPDEDRQSGAMLPIYTVGSWNEEFEGHALFPASFNRSVKRMKYGGFDLPLALKEVFGWNTYQRRDLRVSS